MRLAGRLAIALWLSFPVAGMASGPQQPAGANSAGQAPAPPTSTEQAPAETAPSADSKAPESTPKKKADAGSTGTCAAGVTAKRRKSTAPSSNSGPRRIVVREGGASEPAAQIVPGMPPAEAARQRQNAENLLGSTGDQLEQLTKRTLDAQQQETVGQIRNYMEGARAALKEGDVQRARTLAEKGHLLADDLAKH
jgi:hypothetical protein